ncbi:MAG: hypothetical protein ABSD71_03345 [Bacteroidales bacterium]|jgi:hypothetical protein
MKTKYIFLMICGLVILFTVKAQKGGYLRDDKLIGQKAKEGVYLSSEDFINGKISFSYNRIDNSYRFHLNDVTFKTPIKIVTRNKVIKLNKDSIFGFRDQKNICYRFYNKGTYKILDPVGKILLYSSTFIIGEPKNTHRVTNYFFSENANSPLYPLSKWNLKRVLSKDVSFQILLDVYFPGDKDLTAYDSSNNRYLLNQVYELSKQAICKRDLNN